MLAPASHYRTAHQKSLPRPTIYRQKSAPPGGKFSAEGDLSGGDPIMRKLCMGFSMKGRHINSVIFFPRADFSRERHFSGHRQCSTLYSASLSASAGMPSTPAHSGMYPAQALLGRSTVVCRTSECARCGSTLWRTPIHCYRVRLIDLACLAFSRPRSENRNRRPPCRSVVHVANCLFKLQSRPRSDIVYPSAVFFRLSFFLLPGKVPLIIQFSKNLSLPFMI